MWVAFALQKLLTFFSKKFQHICVSLDVNFNESLTNDVISFEQLGPDYYPSVDGSQRCSSHWGSTVNGIAKIVFIKGIYSAYLVLVP